MNCSFFCFLSYWFVSHNLLLRICILELISSFHHTHSAVFLYYTEIGLKCGCMKMSMDVVVFDDAHDAHRASYVEKLPAVSRSNDNDHSSLICCSAQTAGFLCKYGRLLGSSALRLPFSCVTAITGPVYWPPLAAASICFLASRSSITFSELFEWMPLSLALSRSTSAAIFEAIRSSADGLGLDEAIEPFHSGRSAASLRLASLTREA